MLLSFVAWEDEELSWHGAGRATKAERERAVSTTIRTRIRMVLLNTVGSFTGAIPANTCNFEKDKGSRKCGSIKQSLQ
jgi:hypothetical protein